MLPYDGYNLTSKSYYYRTLAERPEYSPIYPTEAQIDAIRPLRPESLRCLTPFASSEGGLWVLTCYEKELEQAHKALWHDCALKRQTLGNECPVLKDEALLQGISIDGLLDIFPERVTDPCGDPSDRIDLAEEALSPLRQRDDDDGDDADEAEEKELFLKLTRHEFQQEMCRRRYAGYHSSCIKAHVFIEDKHAQTGGGVLHVFLDDYGNVVRQVREHPEWLDNYSGSWMGLFYDELPGYVDGEVGSAYLPGGVRGPPYGQRTPRWLRREAYYVKADERPSVDPRI